MPLERSVKSELRDKVSLANKANVDEVTSLVEAARAGLPEDDADYARLGGWLEDLAGDQGRLGSGPLRRHGLDPDATGSAARAAGPGANPDSGPLSGGSAACAAGGGSRRAR